MELNKLNGFVLLIVLVGMVLGVGVLVLDQFGTATKESTSVVNESVAFVAAAGTSTYDDVLTMVEISNQSISCTTFNSANSCANWTTAGALVLNDSTFPVTTGNYNVSYTYDADTTATTTVASVVTGITPLASTWIPLIITIAVLAIILTLVIRSFNTKR